MRIADRRFRLLSERISTVESAQASQERSAPLYQSPVDIHVSIYKTLTCKGAVYDRHRRKKGYRGIGHPQRSGGRPAAWLRTGTAYRIANQRRFELQPRRSLSHALSHGAAPVDSRRLGN